MSNMSYCRFQNTSKDLDDCADALDELLSGGDVALSRKELEAAQELVATCMRVVQRVAEATGDEQHLDLYDVERHANKALVEANEQVKEEGWS